eukprot:CAMPEP_0114532448 /NCGR_PEP_ID=MMETSP0109-20121206/26672_1 /TAXON_ID=29199 /ORGANISM="Chlorarachnion reptans, Strain CCCM449" /LENGTH=98 /DNA_ID=CAMNT_0001715515 /DNA_START=927 /DNA_END=1219 /DNA_ORIENTATION=-
MIVIGVIVLSRLAVDEVIDILVVAGTFDFVCIAIFVVLFLIPALYTNEMLSVHHPKSVRTIKWQLQKDVNGKKALKIENGGILDKSSGNTMMDAEDSS